MTALGPLLVEVGHTLSLTQRGVAELIGVTARTLQRRQLGPASQLTPSESATLARAVYPKNPELAARIAAAKGLTVERLGIAKPAPAPTGAHLVDSLVCAAAEAMDLLPRVARPGLLAAFTRAREMGLSVETVADALLAAEGKRGKAAKAG